MNITLLLSRLLLSFLLIYAGILIWTKNVDLLIWTKKHIEKILPINQEQPKNIKGTPALQKTISSQSEISDQKTQEPELVLLSPPHKYRYRWIPKEEIAIFQGLKPPKDLGHPILGMRNLSTMPITDITIEWKIADKNPAELIFLSNEHYRKYNPKLEEQTRLFWLSGAPLRKEASTGHGMPVADIDVTDIPFCEPTPSSVSALEVSMPNAVANSFAIRIVATSQRPPKTNVPSGMIKTSGPTIRLVVKYHQSQEEFIRYFRIESSVTVLSDTVGDGNLGHIEQQYWLEENFRATVKFIVVPDRL